MKPWGMCFLKKINLSFLELISTAPYRFSPLRHVHIEKSNAKETSSTTLLTMKPREKRQTAYWF